MALWVSQRLLESLNLVLMDERGGGGGRAQGTPPGQRAPRILQPPQ